MSTAIRYRIRVPTCNTAARLSRTSALSWEPWDRVVHAITCRILFEAIIVLALCASATVLVNSKLEARTLPHCITVTLATAAAAVTLRATLGVALIFATLHARNGYNAR